MLSLIPLYGSIYLLIYSLPPTPSLYLLVTPCSLLILTKGSQRTVAQTAGPVHLLINVVTHIALRGLFILKMNYLKLQHIAVSFLLLPHYCSGWLKTHHRLSTGLISYHLPPFLSFLNDSFLSCPYE